MCGRVSLGVRHFGSGKSLCGCDDMMVVAAKQNMFPLPYQTATEKEVCKCPRPRLQQARIAPELGDSEGVVSALTSITDSLT